MLYWADRGNEPKIECSWLDGQQRKVLVSDGLGWPTGLSIDFTNRDRIYWSDSKESHIESVLPSGEDRKTSVYIGKFSQQQQNKTKKTRGITGAIVVSHHFLVFYQDVRNPFSVNVFEDHVYWTTQEKGEVFRQDKFGGGTKTKLLTAGPWLTQVSLFQQQRYNSVDCKTLA